MGKKNKLVKISKSDLAKFGNYFNEAVVAVEKAHRIDEVKEIENRNEAIRIYALKAGYKKLKEEATEIGLLCEFRGKELAKEMLESGELATKEKGRPSKCSSVVTLPQIGVSRKQSMLWGNLEPVTKAEFEQAIEKVRGKGELTKTAVIHEVVKAPARTAKQQKIAEDAKAGGRALPTGTLFPVIMCDCPWEYDFSPTRSRMIANQYPPETIDYLCKGIFWGEDVRTLFAKDSVIFFWATAPKLEEAFQVLKAWGFRYVTNAVWDKLKIGMGHWFRGQHEHLLVGTRGEGSIPVPVPLEKDRVSSVIQEARTSHSKKPIAAYEIIEKYFPDLPKLELFSRADRDGWISWGNQLDGECVN